MYIVLFMLFIFSAGINLYQYARRHLYDPDGDVIIIHKPDGKTIFSLELNDDPIDFHRKDQLIFKVVEQRVESEQDS